MTAKNFRSDQFRNLARSYRKTLSITARPKNVINHRRQPKGMIEAFFPWLEKQLHYIKPSREHSCCTAEGLMLHSAKSKTYRKGDPRVSQGKEILDIF